MKPYYSKDGIEIYHGDCREVLPTLPHADLILTDPPYGVGIEYASFKDDEDAVVKLVSECLPLFMSRAPLVVLTCGVKRLYDYPRPTHVMSIFYPSGAGCCSWGFTCWQPVLCYGPDPYAGHGSLPDSFQSTEGSKANGHPCPKPIRQWTKLLRRVSFPADLVIDPMMGSGTTLEAAQLLRMRAIGIEIEERYCEIAARRLSQGVLAFT